ncbi:MAG: hypothetical protein ACTSU3_00370 [Candidatus Thorarchaeota archaeon]
MNPKKYVFKQPVVRATLDKIRFPRICPICGDTASKPARITTAPGRKEYLRPEWDPLFYSSARKRIGMQKPETKSLLVHVCDEHYRSDDGDTNYKLLCFIGDGCLSAMLVFVLFIIGGDFWNGRPIHPYFFVFIGVFFLAIGTTVYAFRAAPLQSAIQIIGFDMGLQNIWLKLKIPEYREAFIEENQMHAELVEWIIRG